MGWLVVVEPGILFFCPLLKGNKLPCYCFIVAGRGMRLLGQRQGLYCSQYVSYHERVCSPCSLSLPKSHVCEVGRPTYMLWVQWVCVGVREHWAWGSATFVVCSRQACTLSQGFLLHKPWETAPEGENRQRLIASAHPSRLGAGMRNPWRAVSQPSSQQTF